MDDEAKFCSICGAVLPSDGLHEPSQSKNDVTANSDHAHEQQTQPTEPVNGAPYGNADNSPFGAAYENRNAQAPVDNSPFGAAYETPQSMQRYNNAPPYYNNQGYQNAPPQQQYRNNTASSGNTSSQSDNNTVALVGFILSFIVPIAGLICSIIGFKNSKISGKRRGFALAGIIISAVSMFINIIYYVFLGDIIQYIEYMFSNLYSL